MIFATQDGFGFFQTATGRVDYYSCAGAPLRSINIGAGSPHVIGERDGRLMVYADDAEHDSKQALIFQDHPGFMLAVPFSDGSGLYRDFDDEVVLLDEGGRCVDRKSFEDVEIIPTNWPSPYWIRRSQDYEHDDSVLMRELEPLGDRMLPRFHRAWHSGGQFLGLEGWKALWQFSEISERPLQRSFPDGCHRIMAVGCNPEGCSAIAIRGDEVVGLLAMSDGDFAQSFAVPYWHEWVVVGEGSHVVFSDGRIFEFASSSWCRWPEGAR